MAKELPYFKFEPNQWDNGNIQICTFEEKGVFIDLCSMYWSRLGDLSYKLAVQKLCAGNATALDSLYENEVIKIIDGNICIDFLNEQLLGFENVSTQNSENARLGWEKRRKKVNSSERNATASNPQSESDAIRVEKSREEKKKSIEERKSEFYKLLSTHVSVYGKEMVREFYDHWTEHGAKDKKMRFEKEKSFDHVKRLATWKRNEKRFGQTPKPTFNPLKAYGL